MVDAVELGRNSALYCGSFSLKTFPSKWIISQNHIGAHAVEIGGKAYDIIFIET